MSEHEYRIADILRQKDGKYELTIFRQDDVAWLESQLFKKRGQPYLKCLASGRDRRAYPEEIVRQLYIKKLMDDYGYPKERIQVEKPVFFGSGVSKKRADIVVTHADDPEAAYIIVEVKKPRRRDGIEQLKSYCNAEGSPIGVWTNGGEIVVMHRVDPNLYRALTDIPKANQRLEDINAERVTLARLTEINKLVTERLSLKDVILDLENLVLANAGVDAFEEVFKLIYAKLYDEWRAAQPSHPYLQFRVLDDQDERAFYNRINGLFNQAKRQWPGVFLPGEKIELTPGHLATCVSFLQDIKLFNSNLQVIDEAFEYLMTEVGKGKKGQYFTPRHVIDMAVKMLNPKFDEYVIDPAAGSCGFTVHAIFWVWGEQLSARGPNQSQREYASVHVYGLDFDARAVKIARAINLIAGDGRTNVYRANALAPHLWDDAVRAGMRSRLRRFSDPEQDRWNQEHFRYFDFDIVLTNPPFAGDIREAKILRQYELAKKWRAVDLENPEQIEEYRKDPFRHAFMDSGKWWARQSRDVLFIERALEFLRPGGRMAIVLPQGRFNNITDAYVRAFIASHCRILAVVGLDVNTFKPHTGTKTSILFVQKWNDDPEAGPLCPRVDDYPIFFATSRKSGKDNSGNYIYKTDAQGNRLLDEHGHLIVDHDMDEIATAFVLFAKEQGFSFWKDDDRPF